MNLMTIIMFGNNYKVRQSNRPMSYWWVFRSCGTCREKLDARTLRHTSL